LLDLDPVAAQRPSNGTAEGAFTVRAVGQLDDAVVAV
jgi:hypothetical protein